MFGRSTRNSAFEKADAFSLKSPARRRHSCESRVVVIKYYMSSTIERSQRGGSLLRTQFLAVSGRIRRQCVPISSHECRANHAPTQAQTLRWIFGKAVRARWLSRASKVGTRPSYSDGGTRGAAAKEIHRLLHLALENRKSVRRQWSVRIVLADTQNKRLLWRTRFPGAHRAEAKKPRKDIYHYKVFRRSAAMSFRGNTAIVEGPHNEPHTSLSESRK